ncbi:hypothetical protein D4R51_00815 [bacterium]|nr:MAG: hypothetical protein D4R51_00815 [bacterium]
MLNIKQYFKLFLKHLKLDSTSSLEVEMASVKPRVRPQLGKESDCVVCGHPKVGVLTCGEKVCEDCLLTAPIETIVVAVKGKNHFRAAQYRVPEREIRHWIQGEIAEARAKNCGHCGA